MEKKICSQIALGNLGFSITTSKYSIFILSTTLKICTSQYEIEVPVLEYQWLEELTEFLCLWHFRQQDQEF